MCMIKRFVGFKNAPIGTNEDAKKRYQDKKLKLQGLIQNSLAVAYRQENPKIVHYYNNISYNEVPLWAIFEILTLGDFGYLLSCLTMELREKVSRSLGINLSSDTNRELIYKYVYVLRELRNSIARNNVIYDARFSTINPSKSMKQCLVIETNIPYINFRTIGDYIVLISYYLKLLKVTKEEIYAFIENFESITREYESSIRKDISIITIHPELFYRLNTLKSSI